MFKRSLWCASAVNFEMSLHVFRSCSRHPNRIAIECPIVQFNDSVQRLFVVKFVTRVIVACTHCQVVEVHCKHDIYRQRLADYLHLYNYLIYSSYCNVLFSKTPPNTSIVKQHLSSSSSSFISAFMIRVIQTIEFALESLNSRWVYF